MSKAPPKTFQKSFGNQKRSTQWYRETEDVHLHVFAAVNQIQVSHTTRCANIAKYLALYENLDIAIPGLLRPLQETFGSKLTFNVIRSVIDTAASKIAANKPRPEFNTEDGDYRLKRKAEALTQFTDGVFYQNKTYDQMQDAFKDAALGGTGAIQVFAQGNEIRHERVRVEELLIDDIEGQYRNPPNLYHLKNVFRDLLLARAEAESWDAEAIEAIREAPTTAVYGDQSTSDMISVVECWHLPTRQRDGSLSDGKHAVCLENHTLVYEDYKQPRFPFAFYRWSNRAIGFYGSGLAEELVPLQYEIAQVLRHISKHNRNTGLKVFTQPGSQINPAHLASTNIPVIETLQPPTTATFPAVAQETYQYLETLIRRAYELTGVSQAQASAQKASGVTAAVALTTLNDLQTERFMLNAQRFEQFALDIAELTVMFAKDLYSNGEKPAKATINSRFTKALRWKTDDLDDSTFRLKCFPVSAFSISPAARLQQIQDWMQAGTMPPHRAMQLMGDNPDYRDWVSTETASLNRVQQYLDHMKHDGEYNSPDSVLNLQEAIQLTQAEINRSIVEGVPEHNVMLMRQFMTECAELLAGAQQPDPATMPSDGVSAPPPALPPAPGGEALGAPIPA